MSWTQRSASWKTPTRRRRPLLKTNGRCVRRQMEKAKRPATTLLQDEWSDGQTADGSTNIAVVVVAVAAAEAVRVVHNVAMAVMTCAGRQQLRMTNGCARIACRTSHFGGSFILLDAIHSADYAVA